jgi:hypothetical protein
VSFRVELSPQARAQLAAVNLWWAENRPAAPTLVAAFFPPLKKPQAVAMDRPRAPNGLKSQSNRGVA